MSILCPQCSHENPDQSGFCIKCGTRLAPAASGQTGQSAGKPVMATVAAAPYTPPSMPNPQTGSQPVSAPHPGYTTPAQPAGSYAPTEMSWAGSAQPAATPLYPYPSQAAASQGVSSLYSAFAGRGTLIAHQSWLLEGRHADAPMLRKTIMEQMLHRRYPGVNVTPELLTERGAALESRDYLTVQRGNSTVFIYAAASGNDLYISRATAVQPPISWTRAGILILMILALIFVPFMLNAAANNGSFYGALVSAALLLGFASILLYTAMIGFLIWAFIRSCANLITEKDFAIYLRPNRLNDFQMDDVALLEQATDQVLRYSLATLGMDSNSIVPPVQGYQPKRKLRVV